MVKLPKNVTVYSGAKVYKDEAPDELVDAKLISKLKKQEDKKAANEPIDPDEAFEDEDKSGSDGN